ncbi:hypothetical protein NQ314_013893 [Rhamnusium bicolor]|uniref:protein-synthesizing GTPase n=1 Tax=Rhamnusium bicolor TaxID=1586634 RepID=A0AAV8X4D2_9CUCU|nr:hypothetical protein NQ314_013893 [Rhamnusium bicolor]
MASSEGSGVTTGQPNLHKQDLSKLDVAKLTALSPEVISRQATINIGTIGHVAHGKSTVVKAISGVQTVRFKNELERNITIKLEKLQFDENGNVTWPKNLNGHKVDIDQALQDLENFENERRGTKRKLEKLRKKKILAQEFDQSSRQHKFLVKWKGYPMAQNTWEPLEHLTHCTVLLTQFLAETLGSQVLDTLCDKLNISSKLSDQDLLDMLKIHDLSLLPDKLTVQQKLLRILATPPKERHIHKLEEGKKAILTYQLVLKREVQVKKLQEWEEMINEKAKDEAVITVENNIDLECLPEGFIYINEYVTTAGIVIPDNPTVGCECDECGPKLKSCCGRQPHNGFTFRGRGRVNVNPGIPIYECNKLCKCALDCRNRVVQNGRKVPLCIFRTANGCGWGVRAMRKIHCGEFVCEYVGEVITHEEAETRGRTYDQEGRTYLFDLDYNSRDNPYTVDAAKFGNVSHFINHSCDPNLGVEIEKDEEITFDYMMNIDPVVPTTPEKSRFLHTPDKNQLTKLGYANAKIYKCDNPKCPRPACYISGSSSKDDSFPCLRPACTGRFQLVRHVSFVDCPGHDILMATMLNGAAVMDAALLLIAGNESCPQPQTSEHLAAIEIMKLKHIIILQNKIDLVKEGQAKEQHEQIVKFVQGTVAEGAPIIPISAQLKYNIEVLCEYITKKIPIPVRDFTSEPRLIVIRSFDVNKPGCEVNDLKGGVAGGSILRGVLKVGQEIEVRPGLVSKDSEGKLTCRPIFSRIVSLYTEQNELQFAVPGGLIGVGTKIEPTLCRADRLVGQVLGAVGALPSIFIELEVSYYLLKRLLGVRMEGDKKGAKVQKLSRSEVILVNIGSLSTGGRVVATKADLCKIALTNPVCTEIGEKNST